MVTISPRANRILIALAVGLSLAIVASLFADTAPDSAIRRGDFPAFYTLAVIAHEGAGARLYDLAFQQEIQARYWSSLHTAVLPVAYPAFLAFPLSPLARLEPESARVCWIVCMLLATLASIWILSQRFSSLAPCRWQAFVVWLCFFPLFAGVIGGQAVGLSLLLLAGIVALSIEQSRTAQVLVGTLAGLWMFKPHYALAVVCGLIIQRRGWSLLSWALTSCALWLLGAYVSGIGWLGKWSLFVKRFSHIDLVTNSDQMTGIVPFLFSTIKRLNPSVTDWVEFWSYASLFSAALIPALLLAIHRVVSATAPSNKFLLYLCVPPIVLACAPAANFYDLALLLIPLSATLHPTRHNEIRDMTIVMILGACVTMSREYGIFGGTFLLSSGIGAFVVASRVVKKGSVVSILRVLTKRGGDDEKTAGVSAEIR